jgi:hypothetical protein
VDATGSCPFGIRSRLVRDRKIRQEGFEYGSDLVDHLVASTSKLLESRKAVGVVKRVTTAAIDGWIIKRRVVLLQTQRVEPC